VTYSFKIVLEIEKGVCNFIASAFKVILVCKCLGFVRFFYYNL